MRSLIPAILRSVSRAASFDHSCRRILGSNEINKPFSFAMVIAANRVSWQEELSAGKIPVTWSSLASAK